MNLFFRVLQGSRKRTLSMAALLIAVIAVVDWKNFTNVYYGFLYIFPMILAGAVLRRWQIGLAALFCVALAELFAPFYWAPVTSLPQDILLLIALAGTGLFSREVMANRLIDAENREKLEREAAARREAEEQLQFLIQTSPVAILVMSGGGEILIANSAANHLFRVEEGGLMGKDISTYVPALGRVLSVDRASHKFRTEMQCRGTRENGDIFLANVFFSTYETALGPRLAALVVDTSENLRDRAEYGLEQLMAGSRIVMGAVSHEVRNVCSAITVMYENLARSGVMGTNQDFEALGSLVEALNKIASLELRKSKGGVEAGAVDLAEFLDEARIVLEPYCAESNIEVNWDIPDSLPSVWTDRHSLLNVLLNLAKNSQRALESSTLKKIYISVSVTHGIAFIGFCDTGPGIGSAENLFQPLQKGSDATGLGLFLSRAFMRSFGGDLRYEAGKQLCCFVVELAVVGGSGIGRA